MSYNKYIKYKTKYLMLKQMQGGKKDETGITITPIHTMTPSDTNEFVIMTSDHTTMKTIGKGEIWNDKYVRDLIKYSKQDFNQPNPSYYHYVIKKDNRVAGYVGLHPMIYPYKGELQLRYIISPEYRGQGIATDAVKKFIGIVRKKVMKYHHRIWSVNLDQNVPANKVSLKAGLTYTQREKIDGEWYNYYLLNL